MRRDRMLDSGSVRPRPDYHDTFHKNPCTRAPGCKTAHCNHKTQEGNHVQLKRLMSELAPRQNLEYTVSHRNTQCDGHPDPHQCLTEVGAEAWPIESERTVQNHHCHGKGEGRGHDCSNKHSVHPRLQHEQQQGIENQLKDCARRYVMIE